MDGSRLLKGSLLAVWTLYQVSGGAVIPTGTYATREECEASADRIAVNGTWARCGEAQAASSALGQLDSVERKCAYEFNRRTMRNEPVCTETRTSSSTGESITVEGKCTSQFNRATMRNERVCTGTGEVRRPTR